MDDPRYAHNIAGDISAVTQANRVDVLPRCSRGTTGTRDC